MKHYDAFFDQPLFLPPASSFNSGRDRLSTLFLCPVFGVHYNVNIPGSQSWWAFLSQQDFQSDRRSMKMLEESGGEEGFMSSRYTLLPFVVRKRLRPVASIASA